MTSKAPMTLEEFAFTYGRSNPKLTVKDIAFARAFKAAIKKDDAIRLFALTSDYALEDPKGAFALLSQGLSDCKNDGLVLSDAQFAGALDVAKTAIRSLDDIDDRSTLTGNFMYLLTPLGAKDTTRLVRATNLYLESPSQKPPIAALVDVGFMYGSTNDWLRRYVVAECAHYLSTTATDARREAAEGLVRFAAPNSPAFAAGISNVTAPLTDGEDVLRICMSQAIGMTRAEQSIDAAMLGDAMSASFADHLRPEESNLILITAAEMADRADMKVTAEAESRITASFIEKYFELGQRGHGPVRQAGMRAYFKRMEDEPAYKDKDFGATLAGKIETRLNMVISGVERDSTLVEKLQSRGLLPKPEAA